LFYEIGRQKAADFCLEMTHDFLSNFGLSLGRAVFYQMMNVSWLFALIEFLGFAYIRV